jgi:hypothetical protein
MESWATDTRFSKITSYAGYNCCQIFVGQKSYHIFNYGMVTESSGPDALLEFFRTIGVPISIRRDNAKMQASQAWNDIMRKYNSADECTEPYKNPQQNPAERRISLLKNAMKKTMVETGCDPKAWYHLACHITDVSNHTAYQSLEWRTPIEKRLGETPDISGLLFFKFWEPVYCYDQPSEEPNFKFGERVPRCIKRKYIRLTKRINPLDGLMLSTRKPLYSRTRTIISRYLSQGSLRSTRIPIHQIAMDI